MPLKFKIVKKDKKSNARLGKIMTPHGVIHTPAFVNVATQAAIKALDIEYLKKLGAEAVLCNTYHLMLRPGEDIVKKAGGLHRFMNWQGPMFTDSGGFQVFSLGFGMERCLKKIESICSISGIQRDSRNRTNTRANKKLAKIDNEGVTFRSHIDGSLHRLTPKISMKIQEKLGADIIFAFDECPPPFASREYSKEAMERTHKWALECLRMHKNLSRRSSAKADQALFGIVQGGEFKDLRKESAKFIGSLPFDGFGIGGSFGTACSSPPHQLVNGKILDKTISTRKKTSFLEDDMSNWWGGKKNPMEIILNWVIPELPEKKPRHFLGIGGIDDIFYSVKAGIDTFDCVSPTRLARQGILYFLPKSGGNVKNKFRLHISNTNFKNDFKPLDKNCGCEVCKTYSRAYLHHLFNSNEYLAYILATKHNIYFIQNLFGEIRKAIKNDKLNQLEKRWIK